MEAGAAAGGRVDASAGSDADSPLDISIRELENQIAHLVRSNREMEEILKADGHDADLRTAIGENIVAIARRRAILEDLCRQRPGGARTNAPAAAAQAVATPEDAQMSDAPVAGVFL